MAHVLRPGEGHVLCTTYEKATVLSAPRPHSPRTSRAPASRAAESVFEKSSFKRRRVRCASQQRRALDLRRTVAPPVMARIHQCRRLHVAGSYQLRRLFGFSQLCRANSRAPPPLHRGAPSNAPKTIRRRLRLRRFLGRRHAAPDDPVLINTKGSAGILIARALLSNWQRVSPV